MTTRKRYKLKKKFKLLLLYIFIIAVGIFGLIKLVDWNNYNKSSEGQLLDKGYEIETVGLILTKMNESDVDYLLKEEKIDYVKNIVEDKYFIATNFKSYMSYYQQNSKKDFQDVVAIVNVGADKAWYEDVQTADTSNPYLTLVNKYNSLPEGYDPGTIKTFTATYAYGIVSAEETCYNAFIAMANGARNDGITLVLTGGYRTHEYQTQIFDALVAKGGEQYALDNAAKPGTNEHETGLALDVYTYGGDSKTFKTTETYAWLDAHAHEYGFIERYKDGEEYLTGYTPESWHYRYVGVDIATKVKEEGISYDEYYAFYIAK